MCGLIGYSGLFERAALQVGLQAIAHRGPDDSGFFVDQAENIGLGHARLSIVDLSPLGHQPMASADGKVILAFNGEIYNFRELRAELEAKGFSFRSQSDSEVLLDLYLAEGEAMLPRLNGIFAFAVWDGRHRSMLIARDGLGVKPLYYSVTSRGVAFASEIKGLLPLVPEVRELDIQALHRYLSFLWCPGEATPLKGVRKLMPGEAIIVKQGRIEKRWSWYRLPVMEDWVADLNEQAAIEGTRSYLRQAVRRQMVADVPVGAFLSGGLDSSAIVAFACEHSPNLRCFTIDVEGELEAEEGFAKDLPYARKVARHLGVALDVVRIDASRMADDLERMVFQLDEPLADPASLNVLYISRLARRHGIKVLLSGAGGDDLFSGYRRHLALELGRIWRWLPQRARKQLENITRKIPPRWPLWRRLTKFFHGAGLEGDEWLTCHFFWAPESELLALYTADVRAQLKGIPANSPLMEFLGAIPASRTPLEKMLALEQRFFLSDHNLIYTDKMSMAVGVEVRVPFLDVDLLAFATRIPASLKQKGLVGKWVFKKAMEQYLPKDVIYRPKTGFSAPLRRWMRRELRPLLNDLLSAGSLRRRGLFEPDAVQRLIAGNDAGKVDGSYTLLSLLCLEIWCRIFLENKIPQIPAFHAEI